MYNVPRGTQYTDKRLFMMITHSLIITIFYNESYFITNTIILYLLFHITHSLIITIFYNESYFITNTIILYLLFHITHSQHYERKMIAL